MLIGYSIDDSEHATSVSALLEHLVLDYGFEPTLDIPFCLEYFDASQVDNSHQNLCKDVYNRVVCNTPPQEEESLDTIATGQIAEVILETCMRYDLDSLSMVGLDIIITDESSRIVIWFEVGEEIQWKHQT